MERFFGASDYVNQEHKTTGKLATGTTHKVKFFFFKSL